MKQKGLSIIIPTFNERPNIQKLVDFLIYNGNEKLIEILIVNAKNSNDNIEALNLPDVVKIINSNEACRSKQLQLGANVSNGDFLYFLHADTFPPKNYIHHIFNSLGHYNFGMFSYRFDVKRWNLRFNGWMTQWKGFYTGGGDQGLFIRKIDFQNVNGFNQSLSIMEDYDLFWRLKKEKFKFEIINDPAIVSARKYQKNSAFKINLINLITLLGFKWTGNFKRWSKFYKRHIN